MSSIYKRKTSPKWQIKYRFGNDITPTTRSLNTKNKSRALEIQKKVDRSIDVGIRPDLDEILCGGTPSLNIYDFLDMIEKEITSNLSLSESWRTRQRIYLSHFKRYLKEKRIRHFSQIRINTINDYRNWRLIEPSEKTKETISPKTVKDEIIFLKNSVFDRAIEEKIISENPARKTVKTIKVDSKKYPPFTKEEKDLLIANASDEFHRDFYMALYYTGCRFGEIAHLKWEDVDLTDRTIYITSTSEHKTKNREDKKLPINKKLYKILKARNNTKSSIYVFPSPVKKGAPVVTIGKVFNNLKRRLGIDKSKKLHSFRSAFTTHLHELGVPIEVVQKLAGHKDIRMTRHYQEIDFRLMEKAINKL